MINRLHRELQRCVKMNDVGGYIKIFPTLLVVYFALNRPNYARWGTLFLHKLKSADPELREVLENGAFSIRRTKKNYSRSAVDLSLEQTVNRDSASKMKGIVSFRNSESTMRRWSLSMTQRATVLPRNNLPRAPAGASVLRAPCFRLASTVRLRALAGASTVRAPCVRFASAGEDAAEKEFSS